jgi:AraC-like DNA-binding protein
LFAGIWRHPAGVNRPDRKHFSQSVITAYEELKPFPADRAGLIAENLWVYSKGLLRMVGEKLRFSTWNNSNRKAIVSRFMHFNATTAIRLSDLAEELHLTESRTSHLVKELFGKSFQDLVQDQRIAAAKALLLSSDMTVGQVSACVGWSDPQIFSRMFRRQVGTPPGKFRKENSRNSD